MSAQEWFIGVLCAILCACVPAVIGFVGHRLGSAIPMWIANAAALIMPREQRQDMQDEWLAEIAFIAQNPDAGRWRRSWQASRYAVSLVRSSANIRHATRRLTAAHKSADSWPHRMTQLFMIWQLRRYMKKASLQEVVAVVVIAGVARAVATAHAPSIDTGS
jgi:hypothetical protein